MSEQRSSEQEKIVRPPRVAPYLAGGMSTTLRGVSKRSECWANLHHIANLLHGAMFALSINFPVRLMVLPEGSITGFADESFDMDHVVAARELFIDIPGEETEYLGDLAKQYNIYIVAHSKARWPEVIKDRYFNTTFIVDPAGKVVHRHAKIHLFARERSCTPHDVYDRWVELYGDGIDAFFPVYKSPDIGNIAVMVCNDGMYPEAARAFALNGAEVICRASMAEPMTGNGTWELQNRAHAMFNNCYVIAPNAGPLYLGSTSTEAMDLCGGNGHVVDYNGRVVSRSVSGADTVIAGLIDIEQLRQFRERALFGNWLKDLRTEVFKRMYEEPIHPKNLWLKQEPLHHAEHDEIYRDNIRRLQRRGSYTPPADEVEGSRFMRNIPTEDHFAKDAE